MPPPARRLRNLAQQLLKAGPKPAQRAIQEGEIHVNGRPCLQADVELKVGDVVELVRNPREETPLRENSDVDVVIRFDDEAIVVVEKPAGWLTVPTPYKEKSTLLSELQRRFADDQQTQQICCVHRLDRGVSGLLVFAKSVDVAMLLRDQFAARKPRRRYTAYVQGSLDAATGTFRSYLASDERHMRFSVDSEEEGELAITHYELVERIGDVSVVDVRLETGRRNQIRVHFSEAGHPIVGDRRYHGNVVPHRLWRHRRIALHARELGLNHPVTGKSLAFESEIPPEMREFLERLHGPRGGNPRRGKRRRK